MVGVKDIRLLSENKPHYSDPVAYVAKSVKIKVRDFQSAEKPFAQPKLTNFDVGVQEEKNIIVPSFGTVSIIFSRHFATLRQLKRRLDLLKQAFFSQMDSRKCWETIEKIILVLDEGFRFLSTEDVQASALEIHNNQKPA